ncbi:MAG: NAD(P)/FAD-dependent oxidoreductase [Thermoflexaceae bacterium]|nr:NAD(P)/FAD-dependent oxidoreductase [Thermoflexaceae bacterium]
MTAKDSRTTVVVLGGGIGGQVAATELARGLGRTGRVILVERAAEFVFAPSLPWVMTGDRRPGAITRGYAKLARRGIEVRHCEVTGIDPENSRVETSEGPIAFDYLVVSLGAVPAPEGMPGMEEHAHHPYDLEHAERLRDALAGFGGGRVAVAIASLPYRCPAAPYETALLIDGYLRRRGLRDRSSVTMFTPEPLPMPVTGPYIGHRVAAELARHDIPFHPKVQLERVEEGRLVFGGGTVAEFDLAIVIPPHRPAAVVAASPLAGPNGWVPVDRATLRTRHANVYAIGDITAIPLENGMPLPKAGVFAHGEAVVVAANIARRVRGDLRERPFEGHGMCFLETGGGRAGLARGDFYASPVPKVSMYRPGRSWHLGKVAFEKYWLNRWI